MTFHMNLIRECFSSWVHVTLLKTLMRKPKPMSQRQLALVLGIPSATVHRALADLGESGLIKSTRVGNAIYWDFDRNHCLYEILSPVLEGLGALVPPIKYLQRLIREIFPVPRGCRLILFGSTVTGTDTPASDIDLGVILPNGSAKPPPSLLAKVRKLEEACLKKFGRRLQPVYLTKKALKNTHKELSLNILKGIEIPRDQKI